MIEILRLCACHIDGMEAIENECFSEPWSRNALAQLPDCDYAVYFVALDTEKNTVAGYGGMYVSIDCGAINNIGVLAKYRRMGIGERLLEALCEYSSQNGVALLTLEVRESNFPAIRLYEKNGFTLVGKRRNYYKKPTEDGLLYNKEINGK